MVLGDKMKINAKFMKVSIDQFKKDMIDFGLDNAKIEEIYNQIELPKRATIASAGYDFKSPIDFTLKPGQTIKIPTGIKAYMPDDFVLMLYPRSGLGFKYRLQLNNTVGIIDSDYFHALNEGHIMVKLTNDTNENKVVEIKSGEGFCQGIFLEYGITIDDEVSEIRKGGFGSTTK